MGEWITFVDGDDTLPNHSLATMFEKSKDADTDIIEGYSYHRHHLPQIKSIDDYRRCLLKSVDNVSVTIWGKLFRRKIINAWCFEIPKEIVRGEDWIMNIRIAFMSKKTPVIISDKIYNYRDNDKGLSYQYKKNIDLEYAFFQSWRDSIPSSKKDKYSKYVDRIAVLMYVGVCVTNLRNVEVVDSPFAKEIRLMVKSNAYNLKFHQKILLLSKNRWLRTQVWRVHCYKNRLFC